MAETPAKLRKQQERERKRQNGLTPVQEWVHVDDAPKLKRYAERLRKSKAKAQEG